MVDPLKQIQLKIPCLALEILATTGSILWVRSDQIGTGGFTLENPSFYSLIANQELSEASIPDSENKKFRTRKT